MLGPEASNSTTTMALDGSEPLLGGKKKKFEMSWAGIKAWLVHRTSRLSRRHLKTAGLFIMLVLPTIAFAIQEETENVERSMPTIFGLIAGGEKENVFLPDNFKYSYIEVTMVIQDLKDEPANVSVQLFNDDVEVGDPWILEQPMNSESDSPSVYEHKLFISDTRAAGHRFELDTTSNVPVGVEFHYHGVSSLVEYEVIFAALILAFVYVLIIFELIHRTLSAMLGSFITLGVMSILNKRPSLEVVVEWIDFETIMLLFGMMVIVGVLSETGVFEWSAVKAYKFSGGKTWPLLTMLILFSAGVSAFLDNVTTILLLTPVTIRMCNVIGLEPTPILLAEVVFSNIGGTATAVGDPPNVIIVSSKWDEVKGEKDIEFTEFTSHLFPGIVFVMGVCYLQLRFLMFRHTSLSNPDSPVVAELKREILIWEKTLRKQSCGSKEERKFCAKLERKIEELHMAVDDAALAESSDWAATVKEMELDAQIKDPDLLLNACLVLSAVILMFFLHSHPDIHLDLGWIAVLGAMCLLLISGIHNIEELMMKVEWATLLFFGALFILMEGLAELGLIDWIGTNTADLIKSFPDESREALAIITILWVSAIASSFIDNIPFTTAMIPVIKKIANDESLDDLQLRPLVWALAFGACLGGNGTLIGASANVVMAGLAEQEGISISFNRFFKVGFPIMLVSTFVAMLYLLFCHELFDWK
uniref:Pink-eyed dilution-like 2 n=1 Tax=Didymoeca costata TaxID=459534 RepID=A0A1D8RAG1_9EUKA|nr:pink-eyed dilution-like 2 [Didymoeca costata]|eukprot:m.337278 g.337278  ORF g.337278 m.337278 type:complete len:702 (+) comp18091_c0_seq1:144-2249(+)